jgi:hypothetical protein
VRALVREHVDGLIIRADTVPVLAKWLAVLMRDGPTREAMAMRAGEVVTRFPLEASLSAWDKLLDTCV